MNELSPRSRMKAEQTGAAMPTEIEMTNKDTEDLVTPKMRYRLSSITRSPPPKTTLAAVLLLITGTCMLISGLVVFFNSSGKQDKGISLIALGGIMFLPGVYSSVVIYGTWAGWRGYDYSMIANYDEH